MRNDFDIPNGDIYLNSGTFSRVPRTVLNSLHTHQLEYEKNPTFSLVNGWGKLWQVQKKIAAFFNTDPSNFFFRHNVTGALNDFIMGVELGTGDIAISDLEYGAIVNICKLRAQKDDRKIITFKIPDSSEISTEEDLVESIMDQIPRSTQLLLISHVMTGTGLRIPIGKLAHETKKRDIVLVVDGAHGPGSEKLDFSRLEDVDFYGGNLHKWMMGPKGTGFGVVSPRIHKRLQPITAGWTTFETPANFSEFGDGYHFPLMMLMSSCLNWANFYALSQLIDYWNEKSPEKIWTSLIDLRKFLETESNNILDWKVLSPNNEKLKSPLLNLRAPPEVEKRGYEFMMSLWKKHQVTIAMPIINERFTIRLSPHIYTTKEEITLGLNRIKKESLVR